MTRFFLSFVVGVYAVGASALFAQQNNYLYSYKIGNMEVIMLSDAQQSGKTSILIDATPQMLQQTAPNGTFPNGMNAFLVRISGKNILVDAGLGTRLFENLQTIGIDPLAIDAVLITHLHGDHFGGLTKEGVAAFSNATLYMAQLEYDYGGNNHAVQKAITAYRIELFTPNKIGTAGTELFAGVAAFAAYGHTPGHTVYLFTSEGESILIWGDLTHAMAVQMPYPQVAVTYDSHPQEAVATRLEILKWGSANRVLVAGMHFAYPAIGIVSANAAGGYLFAPVEWE